MKAKKTLAKAKKISTRRKIVAKKAVTRVITKKAPAKAATKIKSTKRKVVRRQRSVVLPPILLEGDSPSAPQASGPGEKYALGPTPPAQGFAAQAGELPEAYGTKRLFLTARDPHWLYVNWDLTREQQARYNRQSADGHLVLRIYFAPPGDGLALEVHVHPESRHWFAYVERAATKYTSELGYYGKNRKWAGIAKSSATLTPPETMSDETGVEFATIPAEISFDELLVLVQEAAPTHQPLARAIEE